MTASPKSITFRKPCHSWWTENQFWKQVRIEYPPGVNPFDIQQSNPRYAEP
jgi:hypothetical protein